MGEEEHQLDFFLRLVSFKRNEGVLREMKEEEGMV